MAEGRTLRSIVLVATLLTAATLTAQTPRQPVDRTTPILRAMSAADAHHSTLFDGFGAPPTRVLDQLTSVEVITDLADVEPNKFYSSRDLARLVVCEGDAVIRGVVIDARSLPTHDGAFLFTTYRVRLARLLRPATLGTLAPGDSVVVVRAGGTMIVDGVTVTTAVNDFPPLSAGAEYYFVADRVQQTGAFQSVASGTFRVSGRSLELVGLAVREELRRMSITEFEAALEGLRCPVERRN